MKHYKKSDYALNKYSEGIVYQFVDGTVEVTLADFLTGNPGKTAADFAALKALSDGIYLEQVQSENSKTRLNSGAYGLEVTKVAIQNHTDDLSIDSIDGQAEAERLCQRCVLAKQALDKLTTIQRRRYLMHHVKGMTIREIAKKEGAFFTTIHQCLQAAEKKIKKILEKG
jgi:hypothetical protein